MEIVFIIIIYDNNRLLHPHIIIYIHIILYTYVLNDNYLREMGVAKLAITLEAETRGQGPQNQT